MAVLRSALESHHSRRVAPVDQALLILIVASVLDGANVTSVFRYVMLGLGIFAIVGHFSARYTPRRMITLRFAATAAIVGLAGSTAISLMGPDARPQSQLLLLLGWCYWLTLFVVFGERISQSRFRNSVMRSIGYTASVVAVARIGEAILLGNAASGSPLLMTRNGYGAVLATLAPIAVFVWLDRSRKAGMLWALMFLSALAINASRGSWVAAAAGLMVVVAAHSARGLLRTLFFQLLGLAALVALVIAVGTTGSLDPVRGRSETLLDLDRDLSRITRLALQEKAFLIVSEQPLAGVGLGNFRHTDIGNESGSELPLRISYRFPNLTAHNSYLELVAEAGLLGAVPILLIIGGAMVAVLRMIRLYARRRSGTELSVGATIFSVGIYLFMWGGLGTTLTWALLGIWLGIAPIDNRRIARRFS